MQKLAYAIVFLAACGGVESDPAVQDLAPARHLYTLVETPFSGAHPTALVHLARGFDPGGPLNLVVHYHGWSNCIENDGEARNSACTKGGPVRIAHNLIGQIDASGVNAALVLIERAFDQPTSADGRLAEAGFFRSMILELLPHIGALAGRDYAEDDLGGIALTSHSGGYIALAHTLDRGGLTDHVTQVILLDSVYGNLAQFEAYARSGGRMAVVYTDHAGTLLNSQHMANDLEDLKPFDDRTYSTLTGAQLDAPLLFKRSALSHDGTGLYYFGRLLAHSGLR